MDRHVLLCRDVRHHVSLQVFNCIEEFLGFGHTFEAVDVDDRDGIAHLIEPILDVGHSPCIRAALVDEVRDQNGLAKPELPCQNILLFAHRWSFHNGSTDA